MSINSRDIILNSIPNSSTPPPLDIDIKCIEPKDRVSQFINMLKSAGGDIDTIDNIIKNLPKGVKVVDTTSTIKNANIYKPSIDEILEVDLLIIKSPLGVAENGAVWIEPQNYHRSLLTLANHIVVFLEKNSIVANMHQAYQKITIDNGYCLFMSGPSKTADIEQSLVIGAHGAMALSVVLLDN